jgi:hypothetical protein
MLISETLHIPDHLYVVFDVNVFYRQMQHL